MLTHMYVYIKVHFQHRKPCRICVATIDLKVHNLKVSLFFNKFCQTKRTDRQTDKHEDVGKFHFQYYSLVMNIVVNICMYCLETLLSRPCSS